MREKAKLDGQPIGPKQTITAEEQRRRLGLDKTATPRPAALAPTPAQARREMAGDWRGEDLDPPDWEASVVSDPQTVAQVLGLRPDDFDGAPLGSQPEGQPIAQPAIRPKIEPRPVDESVTTKRPPTAAEADQLRTFYRAHVAKVTALAESAKSSGDPAREANAAEQVRESAALGERLRAKLGGVL